MKNIWKFFSFFTSFNKIYYQKNAKIVYYNPQNKIVVEIIIKKVKRAQKNLFKMSSKNWN